MAKVIGNNQVQLDDGKVIQAQQGGWYDGQQYWNNSLSQAGVINQFSDQVGAGQSVSDEILRQTSVAAGLAPDANKQYIEKRRQQQGLINPTTSTPQGIPGGAGATPLTPTATSGINLPDLYKQLTQESGISDLEGQYSEMEKAYIDAKAGINDNPFLSEANRVGRVEKLTKQFNERTANIKNDIATKKADVETQLNLQLKQFDINSEATDRAWQQFNTLLNSGALNNATGETIANITRSTGISSDLIYSAVEANRKSNVNPQVIKSTNDAGVVTVSVIDANSGQLINQTSLGAIGNAQNTGSAKQNFNEMEAITLLSDDVRQGKQAQEVFAIYGGLLDPNTILQVYNANSPYGTLRDEDYGLVQSFGVDLERFGQ